MDFNISLSNGNILRGFIKSPGNNLHAMIVMVHGLGEHINRYVTWAGQFNSEGIGFAGVDLPGHGHSQGRRGHIQTYSLLNEMIDILTAECRKTFPGIPVFLYGHSLGGTIVLNYLTSRDPDLNGAIVTSPWLKLSFEPKRSKVVLAEFVKNIFPGLVQPSGLVPEHISHDSEVVSRYINDPMVHDKISVGLFADTMNAAAGALRNASKLTIPLLLMHGSDDLICSPEGSREFASKTTLAEFRLWEGGYHELHNELFRKEVFDYILNWLNCKVA